LLRKSEQKFRNGTPSNEKVSAHQKKQLSESTDNPQNGRKSLPAIQKIKD
jgi:hypothetical protein